MLRSLKNWERSATTPVRIWSKAEIGRPPDCSLSSASGRHRGDQYSLRHALATVPADVACDFAASRRMADQSGILQIERFHERGEIIRIRVHVIAFPRLA